MNADNEDGQRRNRGSKQNKIASQDADIRVRNLSEDTRAPQNAERKFARKREVWNGGGQRTSVCKKTSIPLAA